MVAVREQILAALTTRLATMPNVTIERTRDIEVQRFPSVIVLDGAHEAEHSPHGLTTYRMDVTIELYVSALTAALLGPALNALYSTVITTLMSDPTLGGLALDIQEQGLDAPELGQAEGQGPLLGASLDVLVLFWTPVGAPDTVAPL